jgi:hypothetical protein
MTSRTYIIRPAVFAPAILSVVAVVAAVQESWWFLAALPFIWLGSVAILAGAISGFYVSAIEKRIRMRPAPDAS